MLPLHPKLHHVPYLGLTVNTESPKTNHCKNPLSTCDFKAEQPHITYQSFQSESSYHTNLSNAKTPHRFDPWTMGWGWGQVGASKTVEITYTLDMLKLKWQFPSLCTTFEVGVGSGNAEHLRWCSLVEFLCWGYGPWISASHVEQMWEQIVMWNKLCVQRCVVQHHWFE